MLGIELPEDDVEVYAAEQLMGLVACVIKKGDGCKDDELVLMLLEVGGEEMIDLAGADADELIVAELGDGLGQLTVDDVHVAEVGCDGWHGLIGEGVAGEPFADLPPALLVLGDGRVGILGVLDAEDGDGIVFVRRALCRAEFHAEQGADTAGGTGLDKLISAGRIVDVRKHEVLESSFVGGLGKLLRGKGPVLKGVVCVAV